MKKTIKGHTFVIDQDGDHLFYVRSTSAKSYYASFLQSDGTWGGPSSRWRFASEQGAQIMIRGYVDQTMTPEERAERLKACGWDV